MDIYDFFKIIGVAIDEVSITFEFKSTFSSDYCPSPFVVNHAIQQTGLPSRIVEELTSNGFNLHAEAPLFITSFVLSNIVSNVPAVMLLLPTTIGEYAGTVLALSSTLAGNLLIVGSIANIIVVNEAARKGIQIDWLDHAKLGVPVSIATLAISSAYLWALT